MATAIEAAPPRTSSSDVPYDLTIDLVSRMIETGLYPRDRRVFLRDGKLYEKMAKTHFGGVLVDDRQDDRRRRGGPPAHEVLEHVARNHVLGDESLQTGIPDMTNISPHGSTYYHTRHNPSNPP